MSCLTGVAATFAVAEVLNWQRLAGRVYHRIIFLNESLMAGISYGDMKRIRCSFRVGIEVLLAVRFEQRPSKLTALPF